VKVEVSSGFELTSIFCQHIIRNALLLSAVSAAFSLALLGGILTAALAAAALLAALLTATFAAAALLATLLTATFAATGLFTTITLTARGLLATLLTATLIIFPLVCHVYAPMIRELKAKGVS
jgi:hypothetical protein